MTSQTPRYGIEYPVGSDLVSSLPEHLQGAAESIEKALADVDDRHTTAAYSPVIRNTLEQLQTVKGQPGQIAVVSADPNPANNMYYLCDNTPERYWHRIYTEDKVSTLFKESIYPVTSTRWKFKYAEEAVLVVRVGQMVYVSGFVKFTTVHQFNHEKTGDFMQQGYRPATGLGVIQCVGNSMVSISVQIDGECVFLGNVDNPYMAVSGMWVTNDTWPSA